MRVRLKYLVLHTDRPVRETGTNLRGFIGNRFPEYPILHHHTERPMFTYPLVQYRVIEGTPSILGIGEGADVVGEIADRMDLLDFRTGSYRVTARSLFDRTMPIAAVTEPVQYRFLSPWMALNQENYRRFHSLEGWPERKAFLNRILTGNILSMAKGLSVTIDHRLEVRTHLDQVPVTYKGVGMTGFSGTFLVNLQIPDFLGIGKGVSQGFGTIRRVPEPSRERRGSNGAGTRS